MSTTSMSLTTTVTCIRAVDGICHSWHHYLNLIFTNCVPRPDGPPCINDCVIVAPHETHILGERRAFIGGGRVPAGEDERLPEDRALQRLDQQQAQSMMCL